MTFNDPSAAIQPSVFPVRCNSLASPLAPCYHWPMSRPILNSLPAPPHSRAPLTHPQFPKWNEPRRFFLSPASHSLVLSEVEGSLATRHCLSNRNTPKLKFPASYTKQSPAQFLIATFRALPAMPEECLPVSDRSPDARKLENHLTRFYSATSKFLIDNFVRPVSIRSLSPLKILAGGNSNRHTYEKLEVPLSIAKSATSIFLIDSKQHLIQGEPRRI